LIGIVPAARASAISSSIRPCGVPNSVRRAQCADLQAEPNLRTPSAPSPLLVSPRRATALEPAAGCRSGGRPRFSLVAHPRPAPCAGRVSSLVFACSSWRVASARRTAGRRAGVPVPSRCEDSEARAKHRQERGSRACGSPTPGTLSRELRRVPAGARPGPHGNLVTPGRARSRRCWAPPAPCDLSRRRADAGRANTVPRS
jgi:hypothetical protein